MEYFYFQYISKAFFFFFSNGKIFSWFKIEQEMSKIRIDLGYSDSCVQNFQQNGFDDFFFIRFLEVGGNI